MSKPANLNATRATTPAVSSRATPRRSGMALALLAAFGAHVPALSAPAVTVNNIVPNLKTNTVLTPGAANTTDITTTTIKGGVGLNTFSTFEVGAGNTVNLHVPTAANMLLNVVYDSPILVNGIVNGYKDGALGGKIAFADPHGMVVGASGVLNVGSLSVLTPRADFLAGMVDTTGAVDVAQMNILLAGGAPVSAGGLITIAGRINALDNISLRGAVVNVTGMLGAGADMAHLAAFASTVNTTGMPQAAGVIAHDGIIDIVAAGAATVSGTVAVTHTTGSAAASSVTVTGASVDFNNGAAVTTHGAHVAANGTAITVANGASIDAGTGNVTLAAKSEDLRAGMGDRAAMAALAVDGTLKAANIALTADALAQSDDTGSISNAIVKDASTAAGLFGFKWAETLVNATANVTIGAHSVVTATDALTISASGKQANKLNVALGDSHNPSINSIAAHATVEGGATALVQSGATLSSGGQMVVRATNDASLDLKASVLSYSSDVGVTFAYGQSQLAAAATIEHGASLAAGGLDVISHSGSSYSVQASSSPADTGKAGIAAAVSGMREASNATLGSNITTVGAVRVQADTVVAKNFTKGSTETGSGLAGKLINPAIMTGLNGKYDLLSTGSSLLVNLPTPPPAAMPTPAPPSRLARRWPWSTTRSAPRPPSRRWPPSRPPATWWCWAVWKTTMCTISPKVRSTPPPVPARAPAPTRPPSSAAAPGSRSPSSTMTPAPPSATTRRSMRCTSPSTAPSSNRST
jgi:filamentous hemagglutinin family protein